MRRNARRRLGRIVAVASALALTAGPASGSSPVETKADALVGSGYETVTLWSVGETVPRTSGPSEQHRMVGTPDGMGSPEAASGSTLWVNHKFTNTTLSNPVVDGPTYEGAVVSQLKLDTEGNVVTGGTSPSTRSIRTTHSWAGSRRRPTPRPRSAGSARVRSPAGRSGSPSGIIDTSSLFGPNTWLFNVQAHAPTTAPVAGTVEDGQLLLLRPASV